MRAFQTTALLCLLATTAAVAAPAAGQADNRYTAKSWDDAVETLPCSAFVKGQNGSWSFPGAVMLQDGSSVSNMTFGPNDQSRRLDARCTAGH